MMFTIPRARVSTSTRVRLRCAPSKYQKSRPRAVVSLRDVEGWSSEEVRNVLDVSETNQRVLLHRGRSAVRGALERYLSESEPR